ncbi:MAG: tetratricopeptide repeat protein [Vicingaceae bacterium]
MKRILAIVGTVLILSSCGNDVKEIKDPVETVSVNSKEEKDKITAFNEVNNALKADINNPTLYLKRAKLYVKYDDYSAAVDDLDRAIEVDSVAPEYYLLKAELLKKQDKLKECKEVLDKVMYIDNDNISARLELGYLALIARQYKQGLDYADAVLKKDVYNAEAYFLKGMIFEDKRDTARAISSYVTAIEQENDYYEAYMQVGILSGHNDKVLGKEYIKNALRVKPKSVEALYAYGMLCQQNGDYNDAIEAYHKILEIEEFREPHFNLGFIHQEYLKVYDVAIEHYTNAINLEPKYIDAYYNRALCYEQLDEPKKAVEDLKVALKLNPQYTQAALLMGRILKNNE